MSDHASLPALVRAHGEKFGSMTALVVNAGVGTAGRIADFPMQRLAKTVDVNFTAAMMLIQQAIPLLRKAAEDDPVRGANVIGLASITGVYPESGLAVYGAAKAALVSLLETVNLEESANGINATALAPGYVDTDMAAWVSDRIPADEMIPVADVVSLVSMLVNLSSNTTISRVVLSRSGTTGYTA
jgi:NAD(P)-dependent dehydrogenase (short-subunit alcohol dehydrogenase family)